MNGPKNRWSLAIRRGTTTLMAMMTFSTHAESDPLRETCPCPDNNDPEAVLRCALAIPSDTNDSAVRRCFAQNEDRYPMIRPNPRLPNVYRDYRILSMTNGVTHKGYVTKQIKVQFDYIAKLSERFPGGEPMCKPWTATIYLYQAPQGWLVGREYQLGSEYRDLVAADRRRLNEAQLDNDIHLIQSVSTRIVTLTNASANCPMPRQGKY